MSPVGPVALKFLVPRNGEHFVGPGGQRWTKWSQVVASGVRALEGFGRRAKRVPGPSQTGRGPGESRRSNSPADVLPPCRETLAFAGLARGRPHHQALVASRCRARYACSEALTSCRIAHASGYKYNMQFLYGPKTRV